MPTDPDGSEAPARVVLARVAPYLWPKDAPGLRMRVVLSLLMLVGSKLVAVATPWVFKLAVDMLSGETASDPGTLLALGGVGLTLAYGLTRLLNTGLQQLRSVFFAPVGQRALRQVAMDTFCHIHALSMSYHLTRRTGGLSRVMERGVKGVDFLMRFMLFSIGPLILELILIAGVLWVAFDVWYLAVVVAVVAGYILFTFRVTEWRVGIRREMIALDTEANQRAIDSLLNFETVRYFNARTREAERYDRAMEGYEGAALRTANSLAFLNFGQALLITLGLVTVMVMAAREVTRGTLTVGDFVMVNAYMLQITLPLNMLGSVYREIRQSLVDMGQMFALLDRAPEITDAPDARPLRVDQGHIAFDAVRFGYDPEREILKGLSLEVPAGGSVAIVGPSGAGKSTIGRLLFRFYDVTGGAVRIDGQDVRQVTQESLHAAIGVVPQDTVLFNDTIGYNIAYGRPGATQAEIEAAARAAQIHDFIAGLPKGYDTQVGERGLKLSGGEKQRVGIARTLLKDPPILLLDEATASLDTATEAGIQDALAQAGRGRTVVMIAHRLSTVRDADQILVLDGGAVVERGTHEALLTQGGRYAELWQMQAQDRAA